MGLQRTRGLVAAQFLKFAGGGAAARSLSGGRSPLNAGSLGDLGSWGNEMTRSSLRAAALAVVVLATAGSVSCGSSSSPRPESDRVRSNSQAETDLVRATERERLRALVDANLEVARRLHADDFQLINPFGGSVSKDEYLEGIASGELDYLVWEPETIEVRLYGQAAVIRYRSQLEIVVRGQKIPLRRYWHTDSYEKRDARWQVIWSHATEIK